MSVGLGELVPWTGHGLGPCCCAAGCIESESDPSQPLAAKQPGTPSYPAASYVQEGVSWNSVRIGKGPNDHYIELYLRKGPNDQLTQRWTLTMPQKYYPKLTDTVDYDLCVKGYKLTRNCAYTVTRFGGNWGGAGLSGTTLSNAWKLYFRRGYYFKPDQISATDAWFIYSGQDGDYPFYLTLTTPEFYLMMEPATSESITEASGGTPCAYIKRGTWYVPAEAFDGLAWKVRVWWRVDFNTHYNITGSFPNNLHQSDFGVANQLFFQSDTSAINASAGTDYEELPFGDSGPAFPPP